MLVVFWILTLSRIVRHSSGLKDKGWEKVPLATAVPSALKACSRTKRSGSSQEPQTILVGGEEAVQPVTVVKSRPQSATIDQRHAALEVSISRCAPQPCRGRLILSARSRPVYFTGKVKSICSVSPAFTSMSLLIVCGSPYTGRPLSVFTMS